MKESELFQPVDFVPVTLIEQFADMLVQAATDGMCHWNEQCPSCDCFWSKACSEKEFEIARELFAEGMRRIG